MTNEEVIKFITKQGTLEPPSGCPQKITGYIPMVSALDHVIHTGDKINDKAGHRLQGADQPSQIFSLPHRSYHASILKDVTLNSPNYVFP